VRCLVCIVALLSQRFAECVIFCGTGRRTYLLDECDFDSVDSLWALLVIYVDVYHHFFMLKVLGSLEMDCSRIPVLLDLVGESGIRIDLLWQVLIWDLHRLLD
jgi:hypothetical protein